MATVTYDHNPNDTVWVILTETCGAATNAIRVAHGEVIRVRITVLVTETTIEYDIRLFGQSGTIEAVENDIFAEADLALAMTEYQSRIS